jgi:hypothetical protein
MNIRIWVRNCGERLDPDPRTVYDENGSATLEIESADFGLREGGKERMAS